MLTGLHRLALLRSGIHAALGLLNVPSIPIAEPAGFSWTTSGVPIKRIGSAISTTFDITTLKPAATITYYVDPVGGNDAAAGTSRAAPLKRLSVALQKADADRIIIINLTTHFLARDLYGWAGYRPIKSLSVINESSTYRFLSLRTPNESAHTWTINGTYGDVYQTTISTSNSTDVVDGLYLDTPTWTDVDGNTATSSLHPPVIRRLAKVADLAAVHATAGTWFNDGTITYVRPHDDRNLVGDTKMLCLVGTGNNGRTNNSANDIALYVENIDFIGGQAFYDNKASAITGQVVVFNKCSFQAAGTSTGGGLAVRAFDTLYLYRCGAYNNQLDGYNYKSQEADGTTTGTSPKFVEIESISYGNGEWGSAGLTDNCTTCHDDCRGIRVNGIYPDSSDRPIHDIAKSMTWNLGCYVGPAKDSAYPSVVVGNVSDTAKMWLDTCSIRSLANPKVQAETGATMYYANMIGLSNAGGGTLTTYVP